MSCALCGGEHRGWERCRKVVHAPVSGSSQEATVVHNEANGSSRHGKYADAEKRKAYRREWMRAKRAK